jgi:hypothetical protein
MLANIKRSINILGVSDLIKLKNGTDQEQQLVCLYNTTILGFL